MNISFYLVLIGLAFIAGGVVALCKKTDFEAYALLFFIGSILCIFITLVELAVTCDTQTCAIDDKKFSNVTCMVKPDEKPVRVVYWQKRLFKKTAMKTETVLPGQISIFKHAIVISKNEIDLPF